VTTIKMQASLPKGAVDDIDADRMWSNLGGHYMALVEFEVAERVEPADDAAPTAKLHVTRLELARGGQDDEQLRQGMLARYRARTAVGTLDQEQDPDAGEVQDPGTQVSDADALVDYVNDVGLVAGHPAKATRNKDGSVTIDVAVPATP
jgi:hypothetical protein